MSKVFFRYFLSILSIVVLVIMIQVGTLYMQYGISSKRWEKQVFVDFVEKVQSSFENRSFADYGLGTIVNAVSEIDDDRVSGFLVRDPKGTNVIAFGKTPDGRILNSMVASWSIGQLSSRNKRIDLRIGAVYEMNVQPSSGRMSVSVKELPEEETTVSLPADFKGEKIIGSIMVLLDGSPIMAIDLLTYAPRTYEYSKDIINSCIRGLLFAVPMCLVFACIAAWAISSRNAKYINDVRKSLKDLSHGKPDVKLQRQGNRELDEISTAIEDLGQNLQANAKSRKAWLSSISHDLNTPAAAMKLMIEGMADGVFPMDDETLKELASQNELLSARIGKVIDFSTLQADATVEMDSVPVSAIISEALAGLAPDAKVEVVGTCTDIQCDSSLLSRAVCELLSNALTAKGESAEPVIWRIGQNDDSYVMEIVNEGKLPHSMDSDFFEPWTRGDWSRTSGDGCGLGLPIAVTIMFLHKGSLELEQLDDNHVVAKMKWPKNQ